MTIFVVLSLFLIVMVRKSLILKNLFNFQADYKTYKFYFSQSIYLATWGVNKKLPMASVKTQYLTCTIQNFRDIS